jgi:hypothetical protein
MCEHTIVLGQAFAMFMILVILVGVIVVLGLISHSLDAPRSTRPHRAPKITVYDPNHGKIQKPRLVDKNPQVTSKQAAQLRGRGARVEEYKTPSGVERTWLDRRGRVIGVGSRRKHK